MSPRKLCFRPLNLLLVVLAIVICVTFRLSKKPSSISASNLGAWARPQASGFHETSPVGAAKVLLEFKESPKCSSLAGESWTRGRLATTAEASDEHAERILAALGEGVRKHRKQWEFVFIVSSLEKLGMLQPGKRGLVFAAGSEPLISYFASFGVEIVATDMDAEGAIEKGWATTNQHAKNVDGLFKENLIDREKFDRLVSYRTADMNHVASDLHGTFDFVWSTCSLEHVGSISLGQRFAINSMQLLRPGGAAVHTTEFTLSSLEDTLERDNTVLWRKKDAEQLKDDLRHVGYEIDEFCWHAGDASLDYTPDVPPYKAHDHIKLEIAGHVCTSVGWISRNPQL